VATVTRTKLRNAIAEALWDYVSATQLADVCDDLRMPLAPADVHPMSSKRQYVQSRTKTYEMAQLVATAREVVLDYPHQDLVALLAAIDGTTGGVRGELKNIIFAAVGVKPKIVLRDALNNDVEIVEGADRCLVYDAPLGEDGLSWRSLVYWSAQRDGVAVTGTNERDLTVALFNRLTRSVGSEPELLMLRTYGTLYGEHGFDLPALLPQVYLHYDPYSAEQLGGKPRLFRQRMDFLMLLAHRVRVVLELDGKQHYSDDSGSASPVRYAAMAREDRELRLAGYEVYRFGGHEFVEAQDPAKMLRSFYTQLLTRHGAVGPAG
jgi:very-short-patch-repair endonuclease